MQVASCKPRDLGLCRRSRPSSQAVTELVPKQQQQQLFHALLSSAPSQLLPLRDASQSSVSSSSKRPTHPHTHTHTFAPLSHETPKKIKWCFTGCLSRAVAILLKVRKGPPKFLCPRWGMPHRRPFLQRRGAISSQSYTENLEKNDKHPLETFKNPAQKIPQHFRCLSLVAIKFILAISSKKNKSRQRSSQALPLWTRFQGDFGQCWALFGPEKRRTRERIRKTPNQVKVEWPKALIWKTLLRPHRH